MLYWFFIFWIVSFCRGVEKFGLLFVVGKRILNMRNNKVEKSYENCCWPENLFTPDGTCRNFFYISFKNSATEVGNAPRLSSRPRAVVIWIKIPVVSSSSDDDIQQGNSLVELFEIFSFHRPKMVEHVKKLMVLEKAGYGDRLEELLPVWLIWI